LVRPTFYPPRVLRDAFAGAVRAMTIE